jgi:hypothetical protein
MESIDDSLTIKSIAMKKILFGLLLVAAAAAVFYFFYFKKPSEQLSALQTPAEMIAGKWKIDSLKSLNANDSSVNTFAIMFSNMDSNLHHYEFDFAKDGNVIQRLNEKPVDTNQYRLSDSTNLVTWHGADTSHWHVTQLDSVSLVFQSKDSVVFHLRKVK